MIRKIEREDRLPLDLGVVVVTEGAREAIESLIAGTYEQHLDSVLVRFAGGDWGEIGPVDWALNDQALLNGGRIIGRLELIDGTKVLVVSEAGRLRTFVMLEREY